MTIQTAATRNTCETLRNLWFYQDMSGPHLKEARTLPQGENKREEIYYYYYS